MLYVLSFASVLLAGFLAAWRTMVWMPGRSPRGLPVSLSGQEEETLQALQHDLKVLAHDIGERHVPRRHAQLIEAAEFLERQLQEAGYEVRRQEIDLGEHVVWNVDVQCIGRSRPGEILVVGAHYDTVPGSPGANDNGSAVVANLALARAFSQLAPERTVRFAFFVNEERPYYMTEAMGSLCYAQECRARNENLVGMLCLETIGCYAEEPLSQRYPVNFLRRIYPTAGDFVAVVGNVRSRHFVRDVIRGLRRVDFPSEGMAAPRWLKDIFRSDHASFWLCGYPAAMVTDTANFRYPYYHTAEDTIDKINYVALARVVTGLEESILQLAGKASTP